MDILPCRGVDLPRGCGITGDTSPTDKEACSLSPTAPTPAHVGQENRIMLHAKYAQNVYGKHKHISNKFITHLINNLLNVAL